MYLGKDGHRNSTEKRKDSKAEERTARAFMEIRLKWPRIGTRSAYIRARHKECEGLIASFIDCFARYAVLSRWRQSPGRSELAAVQLWPPGWLVARSAHGMPQLGHGSAPETSPPLKAGKRGIIILALTCAYSNVVGFLRKKEKSERKKK